MEEIYQSFVGSKSPLEKTRLQSQLELPDCLRGSIRIEAGAVTSAAGDAPSVQKLFPASFGQPMLTIRAAAPSASPADAPVLRVGIVLSGGPAPGGHNVICGVFDWLQKLNPKSQLFGFADGPDGILKSRFSLITAATCAQFINQGGFHMIGSGRGKIESEAQKKTALAVCQALRLTGLIVVGGDDSNTYAATHA